MNLVLMLATLALAADAPPPEVAGPIAAELRSRAETDQQAREARTPTLEIDQANTAWLQSVVAEWGWPDAARFGDQAAADAWLLLQHSRDLAFQREGLALIEPLLDQGLVQKGQYALLVDRTRVRSGEPQLYGSQFVPSDGVLLPCPVEDPDGLEARRAAMGLPTMKEYRRRMAKMNPEPVKLSPYADCTPTAP